LAIAPDCVLGRQAVRDPFRAGLHRIGLALDFHSSQRRIVSGPLLDRFPRDR